MTPPPLTPKDSLSVEVEGVRCILDEHDMLAPSRCRRLLSIVDELMKENDRMSREHASALVRSTVALSDLSDAQAQLLAAQEENKKLREDNDKYRRNLARVVSARAALADGECNHAYKLERKIFIQKPDMICVKCGHKFDAALADGKEGGK